MPPGLHTRLEQEPPKGGIFLSQGEYLEAAWIAEEFDEIVLEANKARRQLDVLLPKEPLPKIAPLEKNKIGRYTDFLEKYIKLEADEITAQRVSTIDGLTVAKQGKRNLKELLKPINRNKSSKYKERDWLIRYLELVDQEAVREHANIRLKFDEPPPTMGFVVAYIEGLKQRAGWKDDIVSLLRRHVGNYQERYIEICKGFGCSEFSLGGQTYNVFDARNGQTYLTTYDPSRVKTIHFSDTTVDYSSASNAGITHNLAFLRACVRKPDDVFFHRGKLFEDRELSRRFDSHDLIPYIGTERAQTVLEWASQARQYIDSYVPRPGCSKLENLPKHDEKIVKLIGETAYVAHLLFERLPKVEFDMGERAYSANLTLDVVRADGSRALNRNRVIGKRTADTSDYCNFVHDMEVWLQH